MFIEEHACSHNGTHPAFENLIRNNTDLILVARTASADELHLADSLDINLVETPIALDALIFLANVENSVTSVTTQNIKDVYTGIITNWSDLGGPDTTINPYTRERNSGSQELMESLLMKDLEMLDFPEMMIYGMMGLINILEWDKQGLGYSVYYYTQNMVRSDKIKLLSVDGITPDYENIKSRNYGYTAEVFAIIRDDLDVNSTAYKLYQLLTTEAGQRVVKESGYIPYY
jgi:phosphate transport system substrate-binding protein